MTNARVGYVHPKQATGPGAAEAANNIPGGAHEPPPPLMEVNNPRPTVPPAEMPRADGNAELGETGGNYEEMTPPYRPGPIPAEEEEEE